ncbi:hypothetical protein AWB77_02593 [Caballeronia fortuita]|uniref:DUF2917 domain-containing protein n=1 Tax=Caballeronia fortuita TaxID=1777138 RepID=A0A158BAT9_9BURK|nr:DUF2917 domain-containing protein [Caballeronia fortuita]SAK67185.1 hypothetical protein AWB77_02593 [Caballeronia fortuita]
MREIRTFELDGHGAPTRWVIDRPQTLRVTGGRIWLTVEGSADDYWLDAGASVELKPFTTIWVSATADASWFSMSSDSTRSGARRLSEIVRACFTRRTTWPRIAISKA